MLPERDGDGLGTVGRADLFENRVDVILDAVDGDSELPEPFRSMEGVKVSERFGFDPVDSTRFLQAALDSGLPKIVIDAKNGPWHTLPLRSRTSNQTIVFEEDAYVVVRGCVFDRNYRQGISVISAENLLIEDTVMSNTQGTDPQAGIDFEPNEPWECLKNVVLRRCKSLDNWGMAFDILTIKYDKTSEPLDIRFYELDVPTGGNGVAVLSSDVPIAFNCAKSLMAMVGRSRARRRVMAGRRACCTSGSRAGARSRTCWSARGRRTPRWRSSIRTAGRSGGATPSPMSAAARSRTLRKGFGPPGSDVRSRAPTRTSRSGSTASPAGTSSARTSTGSNRTGGGCRVCGKVAGACDSAVLC